MPARKTVIKLGSVPFLNVKPLMRPLELGLVEHDFEIIYAPPASLSGLLEAGRLEVALIPVARLLRDSMFTVVPDISISSHGPVDSVVVLSTVPIEHIDTVAVDMRSQSSAVLLRIVLESFAGLRPDYFHREPGPGMFEGVEAVMLIGDTGLRSKFDPPEGYRVYDLGQVWSEETGLPFVYGVYGVRRGVELGRNLGALLAAKRLGAGLAGDIAAEEAPGLGLREEVCRTYITRSITYDLGEEEIRGIMTYASLMVELGEIDAPRDIELYGCKGTSVAS